MIENIPQQLLNTMHFPNDISVLIGENGSGKSTLLNLLSKHFLKNGQNVIAIANSIHDKFEAGDKNLKTLRHRSGRRQTKNVFKLAIEFFVNGKDTDIQKLKNAAQALQYVGFDPVIGFKVKHFNESYFNTLPSLKLPDSQNTDVLYLLQEIKNHFSNPDNIFWIEFGDIHSYHYEFFNKIFTYEATLKKFNFIGDTEFFLRKKEKKISMLEASSGELAMIISILYLSIIMTDNTVILIDEPENSLHPRWQKEYIKNLLDIFYFFQPKIIIATHSPLLVNGAELSSDSYKIFKSDNFTFQLQIKEALNVEEVFFRFFDITTPENRFLSDRIIRYFNLLANKKIDLNDFVNAINRFGVNSYDPKQMGVFKAINEIATEISSQNTIG